jgi:hypothetical protein
MRYPRLHRGMIGFFVAATLFVASWPGVSIASCNAVTANDAGGKVFAQFSTYFQSSKNRETQTKTVDFRLAREDKRFGDSDIYIKSCGHLSDGEGKGAAIAALILEKSEHRQGVFLHGAVFQFWHESPDAIENWLSDGKKILSKSAIRGCVFVSAATEITRKELSALFGSGLGRWEALCWNGLYSGYAAVINQDLIDGSFDGEIETRFGDNQLLVRIDIKALVD